MKIKLGPLEVEQDALKDEILYPEYKESPEKVEKYLAEKSKVLDMTLKNTIAGKTVGMIIESILTLVGGIFFVGWSVYVFYTSRDVFIWKEFTLGTAITFFLQALLIMFICFLPVFLIAGVIAIVQAIYGKKS